MEKTLDYSGNLGHYNPRGLIHNYYVIERETVSRNGINSLMVPALRFAYSTVLLHFKG